MPGMTWDESGYLQSVLKKSVSEIQASGIPPKVVTRVTARMSDNGVLIKGTYPTDTIIDGNTLCHVKGVQIVKNLDHIPEDQNDGTTIATILKQPDDTTF